MKASANSELEVIYHPDSALEEARNGVEVDTFLQRLRLLWGERRFLFRVSALGLLVFTLLAFQIPKRYKSTTRLMPPDDRPNSPMAMAAALSGRMSGGLGSVAGEFLGLRTSGELFIGILKSTSVQDDLVNKFNLVQRYGTEREIARQILANSTIISADQHSGIITITVTDGSPQLAAALAQEYVNALNSVVTQLANSSARREREFLEGRLATVKQDLQGAEKDLSEFSSKNGAIDIKEQGKAMVEAAASLNGELIAAESELQGMEQIYTPKNVRVRSSRARVAELRSQLNQLGGKEEVGSDPPSEDNGSLYPSLRKLPLLGVSYSDLYRETRIQEAIFETLTQEYELAKVAEAKETPSVKVLDPAEIPPHKFFPPRLLIMIVGTFLSFGFGVSWVFGKTYWEGIHPRAPRKVFVGEVFQTVKASMPWSPPNGSYFQAASHKMWVKLVKNHLSRDHVG